MPKPTKLQQLKYHLRPGRVYRREDLARWSNAVDRHLKQLLDDGTLTKLAGGLYAYPKNTVFGEAPADDSELVSTFLKDICARPFLRTPLRRRRPMHMRRCSPN